MPCIGTAMKAMNLGLENSLIKILGRWELAAMLPYLEKTFFKCHQHSAALHPQLPPQSLPNHNSHQLHIYMYYVYMYTHAHSRIDFYNHINSPT